MGRRRVAVFLTVAAVLVTAVPAAGASGELDTTFSDDGRRTENVTAGPDPALAVAIHPAGIFVAGRVGGNGGQMFLARYAADGTPDPAFGGGDGRILLDFGPRDDRATGLVIDESNRVVVGGTAGDSDRIVAARFDLFGFPDENYGHNGRAVFSFQTGREVANDVDVMFGQRVVLVGSIPSAGGRMALMRFDDLGQRDLQFGGNGMRAFDFGPGPDVGSGVAVRDDRIVAVGTTGPAGGERIVISKHQANAFPDLNFGSHTGRRILDTSPGAEHGRGVALQEDGRIVAVGDSGGQVVVMRLKPGGALDPTFSEDGIQRTDLPGGTESAAAVAIAPDGDIVIVGRCGGAGGRMFVGRYLSDGQPDPSFSGDGFAPIDFTPARDVGFDVALQPNGAVVAVGGADENRKTAIARVLG